MPAFDGNQQHDAQELLNHLLTNLQEVKPPHLKVELAVASSADDKKLKKNKHLHQQQQQQPHLGSTPNLVHSLDANGSVESNPLLGSKSASPPPPLPTNFIKDNFVGVGVRRIKCLECESSTYSKEEFNTIQVKNTFFVVVLPIFCLFDIHFISYCILFLYLKGILLLR